MEQKVTILENYYVFYIAEVPHALEGKKQHKKKSKQTNKPTTTQQVSFISGFFRSEYTMNSAKLYCRTDSILTLSCL